MANSPQARKRARQNLTKRAHNMAQRSHLRTAIKKVLAAVESGNKEDATAAFKVAQPVIDIMASKGIIHRNKAARHKQRLSARIKQMAA